MFDPSLVQPEPPDVAFRRIDAAVDAARAGARGRNRGQARELLVAELRARGLMLAPPVVDSLVERITAGPAQRQAQSVAALARLAGLAVRSLSAAMRHQQMPSWNVLPVRLVPSRLSFDPIEVIIDPDAREHLAVGACDTIDVWLELAELSSSGQPIEPEVKDTAQQPVAVFRGEYRIGVLDPDASAAWRPLIHKGRDESRTVATYAARRQAGNGQWRLLIGLPHALGNRLLGGADQ
jgi:hypothetical protein